jgi:uncharacterized protein
VRNRFLPKIIVTKVEDIDIATLEANNIKALLLDIDNTLGARHMVEPTPEIVAFIENIKKHGIKVGLISNNSQKRVSSFNKKLKLPTVYAAIKPFKKGFVQALDLLKTDAEYTAIAGDQIFTDIWGGNRMGMFTILVLPINRAENVFIKLKRLMERIVLRKY